MICTLLESAYQYGFEALSPDSDGWRMAVQSSGLIHSRALVDCLVKQNPKKGSR